MDNTKQIFQNSADIKMIELKIKALVEILSNEGVVAKERLDEKLSELMEDTKSDESSKE